MTNLAPIREDSPYDTFHQWNAPTPGNFHGTLSSPSSFSYRSSSHSPFLSYSNTFQQPDKLPLLGLDEWDPDQVYDEISRSCIHYSIEWKLALNKRVVTSDTEQNLVLTPSAYWETVLKPKLERVAGQKFSGKQRVRPDDTAITVAINEHSEHNLTKRFEKTNVDWSPVENQLLIWGDLFRAGRKLRLLITFYYLGDPQSS